MPRVRELPADQLAEMLLGQDFGYAISAHCQRKGGCQGGHHRLAGLLPTSPCNRRCMGVLFQVGFNFKVDPLRPRIRRNEQALSNCLQRAVGAAQPPGR
jgi:hypothetical protein